MNEQIHEMGLGALIIEAMFKKYDEIAAMVSAKAIPGFRKWAKIILRSLVFFFLASLLALGVGIFIEQNDVTVLGRLGIILTMTLLFMFASPIGFALAGKKYVAFIRNFAIYQLLITLVLWLSPMPITLEVLFGLSLIGTILAVINAFGKEAPIKDEDVITIGKTKLRKPTVKTVTHIIFVLLLITAYFPSLRDKVDFWIIDANEPQLIKVNPGDVSGGKIPFFRRGRSVIWVHPEDDGTYVLFNHKGSYDLSKDTLQPITDDIAKRLRRNEKLISPRNLNASESFKLSSIEIPKALKKLSESLSFNEVFEQYSKEMRK
jgi:hypothetical protein